LLLLAVAGAIAGSLGPGGPTRASSFGDAKDEALGRGRMLLDARETVLGEQARRAEQAARARALTLYRVLRLAGIERRGGTPAGDAGRLGGRAVALGSAILERDLAEARSLRAEWRRVRAVRGTLDAASAADAAGAERSPPRIIAAVAPGLVRPVTGAITAPFGVARDGASGAWFFRTAISFAARSTEPVRCPAGGRVVRVEPSLAGGQAVVIEADAHGWTFIISGLGAVSVTPGQSLQKGETVGRAEEQRAATVRLETWRGRTPVDPAALLGRG